MAEQYRLKLSQVLVEIRIFMRSLIESNNVGRRVVGDLLTRLGYYETLERIYEEEMNYREFTNDPELCNAVRNGNRVLALPVADLSLVKQEGVEFEPRTPEHFKRKQKTEVRIKEEVIKFELRRSERLKKKQKIDYVQFF